MKSLFVTLYLKLIFAISISIVITWLSYTELTKQRELAYWQQHMSGFIYLIEQGAKRHDGQAQKTWLNIAFQLVDFSFNIKDTVNEEKNNFGIKRLENSGQFSASILMNDQIIEFYFSNITKQFMEGVNKLMLNELGLLRTLDRAQALESLAAAFQYPVQIVNVSELGLSNFEKQQLTNGLVLFRFDEGISALSDIGLKNSVLKTGGVESFNPYPTQYLIVASIILFFMALVISLILIRPIELRFSLFSKQVDEIKLDQQRNFISVNIRQQGNDELSDLSVKVEDMANRIIQFAHNQQQMTRAVSHEIRTPLVKMNYRLASLESTILTARQSEIIRGLKLNISDLDELVNELLLYSSLDSLASPEMTSLNVKGFLEKLIYSLQQLSPKKIRLITKGDAGQWLTSESYFKRILENLITNAQRYARSQIIVRCVFLEDSLTLHVEDDGTGVSQNMKRRIFEPFIVDDESRNHALNGHGLGLSIVKKMSEILNAQVTVDASEMLNGAKFSVHFKLLKE